MDLIRFPAGGEQVGDPQRQAVDDYEIARRSRSDGVGEGQRLLDGGPSRRPLAAVAAYAFIHLGVVGGGGGDEGHRTLKLAGEAAGELRLAAACAPEDEHKAHQ